MRKWHRVALAIVLVAVVGVAAWQWSQPREPVYQGKRLSYWLRAMEEWDGDTNSAVFVSFRVMGTNAIPPLLNVIESGGGIRPLCHRLQCPAGDDNAHQPALPHQQHDLERNRPGGNRSRGAAIP